MRIRKRQVPLPLSSLTPVPLSDPLLHNLNYSPPPVVQLHTHHDDDDDDDDPSPTQPPKPSNPDEKTAHVGHPHPQPSDHHHLNQRRSPIRGAGAGKGWGYSAAAGGDKHKEHMKKDCGLELLILKGEEDERESRDGDHKGNDDDFRKESILGAETLMGFASGSSSSSHRVLGRWYEGEKAFPLKKRRGSFERGANGATTIMDQKDKKLMKTKANKKCATQQQQNDDDQKQDEHGDAKQGLDHINVNSSNAGATRKRARGGALMEGSRCSRVNGRGWRCWQQTLVGYSLCEHHLGKGRLRSMNSVRSRSMPSTTSSSTASTETEFKRLSASRSSSESLRKEDTKAVIVLDGHDVGEAQGHHENDEGEEEEEEKRLMVTKKRLKLGIVKARSMSSLLGQTNSAIVAVADVDD